MKIICIIPARMNSTRFPGKPMVDILGKPMIGHVYERVSQCSMLDLVVVATCDKEIFDYIELIGGVPVMTGKHHQRATDRCAEALLKIEKGNLKKFDIIIMVQGDEPMIHPDMITQAVQPMLNDSSILVTNLLGCIESREEFEDKNCIKVVCDLKGDALYFSREPIPTRSRTNENTMGKQICVIPFRRDFILKYNQLDPTPLEIAESVDMMRILEHGMKVRMVPTRFKTHAVDTPEDLLVVEEQMKSQC